MEGLYKIKPVIRKIDFIEEGKFKIELKDERIMHFSDKKGHESR